MNKQILTIVLISTSLLLSNFVLQDAFADVIPPKKQMKFNFSSDEVICKEQFIKVISTSNNNPACVKISSVDKIVKFGWAQPVDKTSIDMRKSGELQSIGTVNILDTVKVFGEAGRLESIPRAVGYNVVVEACATSTVRVPEIIVASDSEIKRIILSEKIDANTCQTTATKIKTANSESIKATMTNKGGISEKITSLENKIEKLKEKLASERVRITDKSSISSEYTEPNGTQSVAELRKEITNTRDELNRYQFALHVKPTQVSEFRPASFSDSAIEGALVTKLSVSKSNIQTSNQPKNIFNYNIIFQVCADKTAVHVPEILVTSDIQTKSVKLVDDIAPKSCQRNFVEIDAENPNSISISLKNKGDVSASIDKIEKQIVDIQEKIRIEKENITELIHKTPRVVDYDKTFNALTEKIENLRAELNNSKVNLFILLNNN